MIDNKKEYIICAAIQRLETHTCVKISKPRDIYDVELGPRHMDILHRFEGQVHKGPKAQGFWTSHHRFVSREEAYELAVDCGQIIRGTTPHNCRLFSEDLY